MWYESVKMCVRPSVRPKEWMEKRTRLIDNFHHLLTFYLTGILDTVSVRPSVHAKANWTRTGIWKATFYLTVFNILGKGKNDPKGENCYEEKKSKVLTHLKVSENKTTSSDFMRGNISEKFEWYEKICNNKFTVCREMVVSEFGHMTEFRWSAHFPGHNLKCAQISRKMDLLAAEKCQ